MPEIAFLLGDVAEARNDNHLRLPEAFRASGWRVTALPHDAVRMRHGQVCLGDLDPQRFQLIWLVGFGPAESFLDRMQLLRHVDQRRFVNAIDPLIHLHAKTAWAKRLPETYVSNDLEYLVSILDRGGNWIAKPTAGSFGRDVSRVNAGPAGRAVVAGLIGATGRYCLLQRFVPAVAEGEKRTLMAGGRVIGSYLRRPGSDFRTNLATGADAEPTRLSAEERQLVQAVTDELGTAGVGFAAIDTVYPYLMEVNLANPGGLSTLASVYGEDFGPRVADAVAGSRGVPRGSQ